MLKLLDLRVVLVALGVPLVQESLVYPMHGEGGSKIM